MLIKIQFRIKVLSILSLSLFLCSNAFGQRDKTYTSQTKNSKPHKISGQANAIKKTKKTASVKAKNEFVPVKTTSPYFDDSMYEYGPAEQATSFYFYDENTIDEFGPADNPATYYDYSIDEYGPAERTSRHHDLSIENFTPKRPRFTTFFGRLFNFGSGNTKESSVNSNQVYSGRGAAVKAGAIRTTPILVSRYPSKEEIKQASEKSFFGRSQSGYKSASQITPKPKEVTEVKEVINPR